MPNEPPPPIGGSSGRMMRAGGGSPVRVAIVGAGLMGRWHAYYARRQGADVVAVVDRAPDAAARLARHARNAAVFADLGAMLEAARPHAVHICTPLPSHFPLALQAVDAGVHALVEKPLTQRASETEAVLQKAQEKRVLVCPAHQFAFQRGVLRAAQVLRGLGDPLRAEFTICSAGGREAGGAALDLLVADILPHPLSVLQALWPGSPLQPRDWSASSGRHGELRVQGSTCGVVVDIYASMHARPTRCELEILCTGGSIHLNFFHGYAVIRRGKPSRADKVAQPFLFAGSSFAVAAANLVRRAWRREPAYPGLGALIGRFYAAVEGADPPISARDALAVALVREHVVRQSISGVLPGSGTDRPSG